MLDTPIPAVVITACCVIGLSPSNQFFVSCHRPLGGGVALYPAVFMFEVPPIAVISFGLDGTEDVAPGVDGALPILV